MSKNNVDYHQMERK